MAGEAIDEVILAAVGLIGDDDDIAPLAEQRVLAAVFRREELLDGCEDHAARGHSEQLFQVLPVGGLDRRLAQKLLAIAEGLEKLLVKVIAVGDDDQRRVVHRFGQDQLAGVEDHGEALAAALRMPDHAGALVARAADRRRRADRMLPAS